MKFNKHSNQLGHAFLGASKYHWLKYDEEKLIQTYKSFRAAEMGTRLHNFAAECIELRQKLPKQEKTLNLYVNDAIGFKMITEQVLYFSKNCYGTADAIVFKNDLLRIHDLKTGVSPASPIQLEIYCALFCLEYSVKPEKIKFECRLYQHDARYIHEPTADGIQFIMNKIIVNDRIIDKLNGG